MRGGQKGGQMKTVQKTNLIQLKINPLQYILFLELTTLPSILTPKKK